MDEASRSPLRRILKMVTVMGGMAVLAWAMRDRLISVPNRREQQPLPFKVPKPPEA